MLKRRLSSFKYAFEGVVELLKSTPNAKIHLAAALMVCAMGLYFQIETNEWRSIIFAITIVFAFEAMNTSVENLTNLVSPKYHELAKKTKDLAAAAVLISAIGAFAIGLNIFLPRLFKLFG